MIERTSAKRDREMEFRLWRAILISMTHLLNTVEGDVKAAHDFTLIDLGILILTSHQEDAVPMGTLAAIFGVDPSVVTYRVKRLETRGLVRRIAGSGDRRFSFVHSTPAGVALLPEARQVMLHSAHRHLFSKLEPEEIPVLASAFNRLVETQQASLAPTADTSRPQGVDH